jgi:hypothetical protein
MPWKRPAPCGAFEINPVIPGPAAQLKLNR